MTTPCTINVNGFVIAHTLALRIFYYKIKKFVAHNTKEWYF
jgi:hypothetical protein